MSALVKESIAGGWKCSSLKLELEAGNWSGQKVSWWHKLELINSINPSMLYTSLKSSSPV
jgi:hypothetical protein